MGKRLSWLLAVLLVAACGGEASDEVSATIASDGTESGFSAFGPPGGHDWPEGIPDDIPELSGEIRNIMGDGGHLRLFYEGVSEKAANAWIDELSDLGYELEFLVIETPGGSERAEERAEAGEWDRLRATKGDYMLGFEFGGGTATLDIDGVPEDLIGPDTQWPAEWAGIPEPSRLEIVEVLYLGESGPLVTLAYTTDKDVVGYANEIEAAGFEVIQRSYNQNEEISSITLRNADHEVTLRTYLDGRLNVERIHPDDSMVATPPVVGGDAGDEPGFAVVTKEFPEWLPAVPGGDIGFATDNPDGGFTASVTIGEGHTVAEYVQVLNDAGYAETDTMLMGYILSDGQRTVTIYGDDNGLSPLSIMIQADPS